MTIYWARFFPVFASGSEVGSKPVSGISAEDVRGVIWHKKVQGFYDDAGLVRGLLKRMFDYAPTCGLIHASPVMALPMRRVYRAAAQSGLVCGSSGEGPDHAIGGVRGVYHRAEYADQRGEMLQACSDYIDGLSPSASLGVSPSVALMAFSLFGRAVDP